MSYSLRDKTPVADTVRAMEQLRKLSTGPPVLLLDPVKDLKLNDLQFVGLRDDCQRVEATMSHFSCLECPQFEQHVRNLLPHDSKWDPWARE